MKQLSTLLGLILLICITQGVKAQTQTDSTNQFSGGSFLRIGHNIYNNAQKDRFGIDLNLEWEKPLAPRWTLSANFYKDFSSREGGNPDVLSGSRDFFTGNIYRGEAHDIRASLSLGLTYYFKPNTYDGFYASYRINNALTFSDRTYYEDGNLIASDKSVLSSLPSTGVYLGYRKVFKNNFYIDAQAGFLMRPEYRQLRHHTWQSLDFKLGVGYQIKWPKKKRKR